MNNHEIITRNPPANNLIQCMNQLQKLIPNSSLLERYAVAGWWTGQQPKLLKKILRPYTLSVLEKENQ